MLKFVVWVLRSGCGICTKDQRRTGGVHQKIGNNAHSTYAQENTSDSRKLRQYVHMIIMYLHRHSLGIKKIMHRIYEYQRTVIHLPGKSIVVLKCKNSPILLFRLLEKIRSLVETKRLASAYVSVKINRKQQRRINLHQATTRLIQSVAEAVESLDDMEHRLILMTNRHVIVIWLRECIYYSKVYDDRDVASYIDVAGLVRGKSSQMTAVQNKLMLRVRANDSGGLTFDYSDHGSNDYRNLRYTLACL